METNPYQPPLADCELPPAPLASALPRVDRRRLVVGRETVLPPICVRTNEPVSERDMIRRRFVYWPPWVFLALVVASWPFLLGGPTFGGNLLLNTVVRIVPLLAALAALALRCRSCTLTYGLHPRVRQDRRRRIAVALVALATVMATAAALFWQFHDFAAVMPLLFVVALATFLRIRQAALQVERYRDGMFWIKGCCPAFLSTMRRRSPPGDAVPAAVELASPSGEHRP